jgi:hypothetical protein
MLSLRNRKKMLRTALELGERAAQKAGLRLHSLAVGLPGDSPGRVRLSLRDPAGDEWRLPPEPGWQTPAQILRFLDTPYSPSTN